MVFDVVVLGGIVVFPGRGVRRADIGISEGRIVAIAEPTGNVQGRETIDASGKHVFPGIIDTHTHVGIGQGVQDFAVETKAAALGGVTSFMLFLREPKPYGDVFHKTVAAGDSMSYIDYGFHATILIEEHIREIPQYANEFGIKSFKFYMTHRGQNAQARSFDLNMETWPDINDGFMYRTFRAVAENPGAFVIVHCENIELIETLQAELKSKGEDSVAAWNASRPPIAEVEAINRALQFAEFTGARMQVLHLTTAAGLDAVRRFRKRYPNIQVEVCHPYLVCHEGSGTDNRFKMRPPLRTPMDVEALWQGVADGTVDTIGTDHVPRPLSAKEGTIWSLSSGAPGTHFLLPAVLNEGYHRRGIPLEQLAEVMSLRPAQVYGLYPRKGNIEIGADADLTIVDLDAERQVRAADFPGSGDFSIYEGMTFKGWPTATIVRGHKVMENGTICGQSGWGKYQRR